MRPKWKAPFRIDAVDKIDKEWDAKAVPGVYVIRKKNSIPRIGGIDKNGILYIGQAYNLAQRLNLYQYAGHKATYFLLRQSQIACRILGEKWRSDKELYSILGSLKAKSVYPLSKKSLNKAERAILFAYLKKFGELPPLNSNLPGSQKVNPDKAELRWAMKGIL